MEHKEETSLIPFESDSKIDFVGSPHALKELFALPATQSASLVVHNVEGVLLIEQGHPTTTTSSRREPPPQELSRYIPLTATNYPAYRAWNYGPHSIYISPAPDNIYQNVVVRVDEMEHWRDLRQNNNNNNTRTYAQVAQLPPTTTTTQPMQQQEPPICNIPLSLPSPVIPQKEQAPISTVLDVYLDNLLANVPQLALCLQEKGLLQTVKILQTKDIPSMLSSSNILDTTTPFNYVHVDNKQETIFSPKVIDVHAHSLLSLLQTQCHKDHATYLLQQENGKVQLYDVSSIRRPRQWTWWLAVTSGRFAQRLAVLEPHITDPTRKRSFRNRQRSLLENAIELCQELAEDGAKLHEVYMMTHWSIELAKTYSTKTLDALSKASDHLQNAIWALQPFYDKRVREDSTVVESVNLDDEEEDDDEGMGLDALASRLLELKFLLLQVCKDLLQIHLENFDSSSSMRSLRKMARLVAQSYQLTKHKSDNNRDTSRVKEFYQLVWLESGDFARSFTTGDAWRDRGHISGEDIISTLANVHDSLDSMGEIFDGSAEGGDAVFRIKLNNVDSTDSLSGIRERDSTSEDVEAALKLLESQTLILREKRSVLVAAVYAYHRARLCAEKFSESEASAQTTQTLSSEMRFQVEKKFGDACNEIGKILLNEVRSYLSRRPPKQANDPAGVASVLLKAAETWFIDGVNSFTKSGDKVNETLLRCNLCQCYKIRANAMFAPEKSTQTIEGPTHADKCLTKAIDQLHKAHESLFSREENPTSWDMVSTELASTFLVLGVRRRQALIGTGSTPMIIQALRLAPGKESSIVEPIEKALEIYAGMQNHHQVAATHYQLAQFYTKIWTCQRDEMKTREKLSLAFKHFNEALAYFISEVAGNESTLCLICIDLANLYATVSGEEPTKKALLRCLDTAPAFSPDAINRECSRISNRASWLDRMGTLASTIEERTLKYIRALAKMEEDGGNSSTVYKDLYRVALQCKMQGLEKDLPVERTNDAKLDSLIDRLLSLFSLLTRLRSELNVQ